MIYLFTGNSQYLIDSEINNWKTKFVEKFGDFNLIHIKASDIIDSNILESNILGASFLAESKLIIIDLNNNDNIDLIIEFLSKNIDNIPDKNLLVINSLNFDKRTKLYKEIKTKGEIKEYSILEKDKNNTEIKNIINKKYSDKISSGAINTIIDYKSKNLYKIISEIDKLLITNSFIDEEIIKKNILPEFEESIFILIDNILNLNKQKAIINLYTILEQTSIYLLYNTLLSNIRTSLYILLLKSKRLNTNEINNILELKNRAFLINKNYKINFDNLKNFYINLVNLDKKNKSGKLLGGGADLGSTDDIFKSEIELLILNL